MAKRGRLSKQEENSILRLIDKHDIKYIAKTLDRTPETIQAWIDLNRRPSESSSPEGFKTAIRQELRHSLMWQNLKKEFSKEELEFFEEEYLKMMRQFKDDVLASEENQIFDYVKVCILLSRCLQRQNKTREEADNIRGEVRKIKEKFPSMDLMDKDVRDLVVNLMNRIAFLETAEQSHINEYTKLSKDKSGLVESLKATRNQRIKEVENENRFIDLVKKFQRKEVQEQESRHMEILRIGTEKEYKRLTTPHKFMDDKVDLPILTADSLDELDAAAKKEDENDDE